MGRIGDIETKSLSARVPMETYIHFLATASKNKQTISSYLCDVLINVSANRKPQSFENGGITREQLLNANSQAFKGADRLRKTIKDQELRLNSQSETIGQLRKKITELQIDNETIKRNIEENYLEKSDMLLYITYPKTKGGEIKLMGDSPLMDKNIIDISTLLNVWLKKNNCQINAIK